LYIVLLKTISKIIYHIVKIKFKDEQLYTNSKDIQEKSAGRNSQSWF